MVPNLFAVEDGNSSAGAEIALAHDLILSHQTAVLQHNFFYNLLPLGQLRI